MFFMVNGCVILCVFLKMKVGYGFLMMYNLLIVLKFVLEDK